MEEDIPSRNPDAKLAILDMKVWLDEDRCAVYQHYEKQVASKQILKAKSAQSSSCKRSVHVNEMMRRILNTSDRLDWETSVAPVLTDYCVRMRLAGYDEHYRKRTLEQTLGRFDRMVQEAQDGKPIHRPKNWHCEERRQQKNKKKHNWGTKGGYIAPIIIPSTPDSELLQMLREVTETDMMPGLKFKLVERGGTMVKWTLQNTNPTAMPGCSSRECPACKWGRGEGGPCRKSNTLYEFACQQCPSGDRAVYLGETARNLYTRGREHANNYTPGCSSRECPACKWHSCQQSKQSSV